MPHSSPIPSLATSLPIDDATAAALQVEQDRFLAGACQVPASLLPEMHALSERSRRLAHQADLLRSDLVWAYGPQPSELMGTKLIAECAADVQMATRLLAKVAKRLQSNHQEGLLES